MKTKTTKPVVFLNETVKKTNRKPTSFAFSTINSFSTGEPWLNFSSASLKKRGQKFTNFFTTICCIVGLFLSTASMGQTTPANCTAGCTSNDVQIQASYLSNSAGVKLGSDFVCPVSGTAQVFLTLELTTNTPRVGVAIYANIRALDASGNPTGSPIAQLGQCFGITLNQPTNKVTFQQSFDWNCGTGIALTDVFIAWGTGKKDFCEGSGGNFQCPATPSKCFQLPGGSFIAIETPKPIDNSDELCPDVAGGNTATFNLNNINVTSSTNVTITWWETYTAPSTFSNSIGSPGSYSSGSKDVYAKITSNTDATVFSVATVTLTVYQSPTANAGSDVTINCTTTSTTLGASGGVSYSWSPSTGLSATNISNPIATPASTTTYTVTVTGANGCTATDDVKVTVDDTIPDTPTICVVQPSLCGPETGSITILAPLGAVYEYSIDDGTTWQSDVDFSNLAAGSVTGIKVKNINTGCISNGADCSVSDCSAPSAKLSEAKSSETIIKTNETTIKAFPNPFRDTINFVIEVPESGDGSLELMNLMGQRVRTVFDGKFTAGKNTYEVNLPSQQTSTLIYVLWVGGKRLTGKLIQTK